MTLKREHLAHRLQLKIDAQRKAEAVKARFAGELPLDRREQRKQDAAAGLVPFACKLPSNLAETLRERAAGHAGGLNGLVAELLQKGLG